MMAKSANGAQTPALADAITSIEGETKVLLEPGQPIDTDTRSQRVAESTGLQENGRTGAGVNTLPGADPELQKLLHDSPFLDLSSPMTPYEWFKFFVMVGCLSTHLCCCHLLCTSAIIFCSCHHPSGTMKLEHRWLFVARQEPHLLLVHCPRMQSCD